MVLTMAALLTQLIFSFLKESRIWIESVFISAKCRLLSLKRSSLSSLFRLLILVTMLEGIKRLVFLKGLGLFSISGATVSVAKIVTLSKTSQYDWTEQLMNKEHLLITIGYIVNLRVSGVYLVQFLVTLFLFLTLKFFKGKFSNHQHKYFSLFF